MAFLPKEPLLHRLAERFVSELKPGRIRRLSVRAGDVPELVLAVRGGFVHDLGDLIGRRVRRHRFGSVIALITLSTNASYASCLPLSNDRVKKSVFIPPGSIVFMPMPNRFNSKAMLSQKPSSPHFVAWYIELNGTAIKPPIDVVVIASA